MAEVPISNFSDTWNNAGTTFDVDYANVTDTASQAGSFLFRRSVGGVDKFAVRKDGAVVTGSWRGTAIGATFGGTGLTSYAAGDILYASAADTLAKLAKGSDDQILALASGLPAWRWPSLPQISVSAARTLALTDAAHQLYRPTSDSTARTWTIPANASIAFPVGTVITMLNDGSAGDITIAITSDTLVWVPDGTTGSRTLAPFGAATILKVASTRWWISGSGLT